MSDDAAELARQFARTLEDLSTRHELAYVGASAMPQPTEDAPSEATAEPEVDTTASADANVGSSTPDAPSSAGGSTMTAAPPAEPTPSPAPPQSRPEAKRAPQPELPRGDARQSHPPSSPAPRRAPPPRAAPSPAAASESPATIADPVRRADAAKARSTALREQAKQWSAATKLQYLQRRSVGDCQRCPLARTRNKIVFGVGNPEADLMFVGEAPGADEDRQGEPFVGRGGQLLNRWLHELGLRREDVYIANVLKCRPPGNRDPRPQEVDRCSPFLQAQIRSIVPKVIVALGRHAGMLLSRRDDMTLRKMRTSTRLVYDAGAPKSDPTAHLRIPLVVTYHPAYVLRQEGDGRRPPPNAQPGRASPTEMVMHDLRRALNIVNAG